MKNKVVSKQVANKRALTKNTPLARGTEVNVKKRARLYRGVYAKSEIEGLPIKTLPRHLDTDVKDEATLGAAYARFGVGDVEVKDLDNLTVTKKKPRQKKPAAKKTLR